MRVIMIWIVSVILGSFSLNMYAEPLTDQKIESAIDDDPVVRSYLNLKGVLARLPALNENGVVLPEAMLLDRLRATVQSEKINVDDLVLTPEKGTLIVSKRGWLQSRHKIEFRFLPVDWPNRTVNIAYHTESNAISEYALGRLLGTLAVGAMQAATNSTVEELTDGLAYLTLTPERASIRLDKVPSLSPILNANILGMRPFDYIGIEDLSTVKDGVQIKLKRY